MVTAIAGFPLKKIGLQGVISVGDGKSSFGDFNQYDANGTLVLPWRELIERAFTFGRSVYVLEGEYNASTGYATISLNYPLLDIAPGAQITVSHSGAIGALLFSGCIGARVTGGRFTVPNVVNDQAIVKLQNGFNNRVSNLDIDITTSSGSSSNPMIGILASEETESLFDNCRVKTNTGTIGMRDLNGNRNTWDNPKISNGSNQETTDVISIRDCYIGFDLYDCQFCDVRSMRAWGVGNAFGTQPRAMLRVFGSGSKTEDGHCTIDSPHMELCAPDAYILVEGSQGWVTIKNPQLGLANYGIGTLGHAAIKVTRNATASRNSARVDIEGGRIHNVGRSVGIAQTLFALTRGTITAATTINVTGTNTFQRNTGSWAVTPVAGEWILTTNFTAGANNGHFKVVSATSNTIVVDTTLSGALTNEAGTGDETITGELAFEGTAVWLEYCSDVNIKGLSITDQRHQWGISIDTTTVRGVTIDGGCVFHKGSGSGGIAPIRIPAGTMPDQTTALNDAEGIGLGSIWLKQWGATPKPMSNGTVTPTLGTTAASPTTSNAPYFSGGVGDSNTNYDQAGVGVATDKLSLIRRLS